MPTVDPTGPGGADLDELLRRSSTSCVTVVERLHECEHRIAELIERRGHRAWTDREHGSYLRLRQEQTRLRRRLQRVQRVFDRVRTRSRDADHHR